MSSQLVEMSEDGVLIIPVQFRRKLRINAGDAVVVELADGGLKIHSVQTDVRMAQSIVNEFSPEKTSLVDEFLAERKIASDRD